MRAVVGARHPFRLTTPEGALDALRDRLRGARWAGPLLDGAGWDLGTDVEYLRALVAYWADGFDWAAQETELNELPHYRATVDGVGIHYGHVAAGGDLGSAVTRFLGLDHTEHVVAIHRTDAGLPLLQVDAAELTDEERAYLADVDRWRAAEGAYALLQRTKPQTLAHALNDSPVGLAAWIVEKLRAWSDCDGDVERRFTKDELLTNITVYWLTETIGSSFRLYHDAAQIPMDQHARRVELPCGHAVFRRDVAIPPRSWAERTSNID